MAVNDQEAEWQIGYTGVFVCTSIKTKMMAVTDILDYIAALTQLLLCIVVAIDIVLPEGIGPDLTALFLRGIRGPGGVIKTGVRGEPCQGIMYLSAPASAQQLFNSIYKLFTVCCISCTTTNFLLPKSGCLSSSLLCQDTVFPLRRSSNNARLWFCGQQHSKVQP